MNGVLNFLIFQVEWWLCVLHAKPYFHYGYFVALGLLVFNLYLNYFKWLECFVVILMASLGILNDLFLKRIGILNFSTFLWLMVLWLCFSAWFYKTKWLHKKYVLTGLLFMGFGPLSYILGARFGAIQISSFNFTNTLIGLVDWFCIGIIFVAMTKVPNFSKMQSYLDRDHGSP